MSTPTLDDLGGVVGEVLDEVHTTTPVRLAWRPGWGVLAERQGAVAGVVHLAGVAPSPHWVEPMDRRVSAPVEWRLGRDDDPHDPHDTRVETLGQVADAVQDLVQVELWRRGLDPTWPPCPAHPDAHPLQPGWNDLAGLWVCRRGAALLPLGRLVDGDGLLRRRPLPSPGPGALAELADLVLVEVRRTSDVEPAYEPDPGDPRRGTVTVRSDGAPALRAEVDAALTSDISSWIWALPPAERPIEIPEGHEPVWEDPPVGMTLWSVARTVTDLVRTVRPDWPACPDHPGAHRLSLPDGLGNTDDTVLWRCPDGRAVAFVGDL